MLRPLVIALVASLLQASGADLNESFWQAARDGDVTRIATLLDQGVDVNAAARYDMTALIFAADKGHLDAVRLLVTRGANVDAQETFYRARAIDMALANGHAEVAIFLLQHGSAGAEEALRTGIRTDNAALVKAALAGNLGRQTLESTLAAAERDKRPALVPLIKAALDRTSPDPELPAVTVDAAVLAKYAGAYREPGAGLTATVTVQDGNLVAVVNGQPSISLVPTGEATFRTATAQNLTVTFNSRAGLVESMTVGRADGAFTLTRTAPQAPAAPPANIAAAPPAAAGSAPVARAAPRNWPSFRGEGGSGNGDGQGAVAEWDVSSGRNIRWKTSVPGIANSSPIVWGSRVFVTTAVSKAGDNSFRTGLYGDVKPVDDLSEHEWKIYCLDKSTGKVLWERLAFTGKPRVKRHTKASQANSTPVTDGRRVVAAFGSIGVLVAWDMDGRELWRADLGVLDSGWFLDPAYQWGHSSSPIVYRNSVILQADMQKGSYLAAWDLSTGKQLWKTLRPEEISTWGTPALVRDAEGRDEIVTNGTKIRGYDPATGKDRWTLAPNSEITVATPVAGHGLVFVTGGYPPVRPVYAIRPGADGNITLPSGATSSAAIAWSNSTEGTYIPTPVVYGDRLYTLNINGIVTAYEARTGQRAFRGRVGAGGAFSASPIAADGRLYVASEDGEVYVLAAGPELTQIARNDMKEVIMATPAISDGLLIVRTLGHLYGIGQ